MDVDACIKKYNLMCKRIFTNKGLPVRLEAAKGSRFGIGKKSVALRGAFDHTVLEECIREVVKESGSEHATDELLDNGREGRCKV